jgi:hypothetical protein
MPKIRLLLLPTLALALLLGSNANAIPMSYGVDVVVSLDNGYGLPAGLYVGAGSATIDVLGTEPAGYWGATLLALEVTLGTDVWTLADATAAFAGITLDGVPVGLFYQGLNALGHLIQLTYNPEELATADFNFPDENRFAVGEYTLTDSPVVPEPGAIALFGFGLIVVGTRIRRSLQA